MVRASGERRAIRAAHEPRRHGRATTRAPDRPESLLELQRMAGNKAVAAVLQRRKDGEQTPVRPPGDTSVRVGGAALPADAVLDVSIERDVNQVDMCTVHLRAVPVEINHGAQIGVAFGSGATAFSGEVVGIERSMKGGEPAVLVVRALNLLHRLARGKKSRVFTDKTERQIVEHIAAEHRLTAVFEGTDMKSRQVYQHNQTDLEFLRTRAARAGSNIWCEGSELHIGPPSRAASAKTLRIDKEGTGRRFSARLSRDSANSSDRRITGEATVAGDPGVKPDMLITLVTQDPRFDGEYYVTGVSHRYARDDKHGGGLTTILRVTRAA